MPGDHVRLTLVPYSSVDNTRPIVHTVEYQTAFLSVVLQESANDSTYCNKQVSDFTRVVKLRYSFSGREMIYGKALRTLKDIL